MIRFYERREGTLVENTKFVPHSLILVTNPDAQEIADLAGQFSFEKDFITDALDIEERARFEVENDTLLIILKVPYKNEDKTRKIPFSTVSLGIIVGKEYVLLVSRSQIPFIERMVDKKVLNPKKKTQLVFLIFFRNSEVFLKSLEEINFTLNQIEERLHESTRNVELERLMQLEKSLVYFSTSLRTNQVMIERLLRSPLLVKYEEDTDLLEDTLVENSQAIEMTSIYSNILSSMMDAYASVISNNLNIVLKILTVVTILMQVPTIIASIYGMNVPLPLQTSTYAFPLIILWVAIASVIIVYLFRYKRWM